MSSRALIALCTLFSASVAAAAVPFIAPDALLMASDHQAAGKLIAACIEAKAARSGVREAEDDFRQALEKWGKKRAAKDKDPLSLTEDLQASLWYAADYSRQRGIKKGKVAEMETTTVWGRNIEYALYAPSKYRATEGYPVIFLIPDQDERVTDHITEKWVLNDLRDNVILAAVPMPEKIEDWTARGDEDTPSGIANLFAVFQDVTSRYATDFDRIYIAGYGAGVPAAVRIASLFPHRFAGVIGRSGDAGDEPPDNFWDLPCFFAGAGRQATEFAEKANGEEGHAPVTLKADGKEEDIWAWMQGNPRISNPAEVVLLERVSYATKIYWVDIPAVDSSTVARIVAKADRATNTITLKAEGITTVTLYFNDILVDLDKPVKVIANGVEHEDLIPRNFETTMDLIYKTHSDPGKLYTAKQVYDLTPEAPK